MDQRNHTTHRKAFDRTFTGFVTTLAVATLSACVEGGSGSALGQAQARTIQVDPSGNCRDVMANFDAAGSPTGRQAAAGSLASYISVHGAGTSERVPAPGGARVPASDTTPDLLFAVVRTGNLDSSVEVHYQTSGGTAYEYADYEPAHGVIAFAPQETLKFIRVRVYDDHEPECPEDLTVVLTAAHPGAEIVEDRATGIVLDDDNDRSGIGSGASAPAARAPFEPAAGYCGDMTRQAITEVSACTVVSCLTGQPVHWTHCPAAEDVLATARHTLRPYDPAGYTSGNTAEYGMVFGSLENPAIPLDELSLPEACDYLQNTQCDDPWGLIHAVIKNLLRR